MKPKKINSILVSEGSCYRETRQHQKERGFYKMSKWLDDAIFYEIYPQSFKDTNGDGIGDFQGIIEKLDYIRELGCNALWINPCFLSPFGDAGYDVADYCRVAPRYGTNEDLKQLFEEAHKKGIHVLLDLVPGHTSIEHPWFIESMKADKNPYTDRYIWTDKVWESPEVSFGGSLRGISERDGAVAVNFFSNQPALNYGFYQPDPEKPWQQSIDDEGPQATIAAMEDVMRFWLGMGCDGFRVDMAESLVKNDPEKKGTIRVWKQIREFLDKEFPDAAMVSEWGDPQRSLEGGFHMDFLLEFGTSHSNDLFRCKEPYFSSRAKGNIYDFVESYKENCEKTAGKGLMCMFSGNHDVDRLARHLHGDELKVAFAFILSMPGAPFIYYGDEIGMRYVEGLKSVEGGYNRTGSRSPMQWDDSTNAGFSSAPASELYIAMDPDKDRPTAKKEMAAPDSLYHEVKKLIRIRQSHKALQSRGKITFVYAEKNAYPLAYIREAGDEKILVIINAAAEAKTFACDAEPKEAIYNFGAAAEAKNGKITVPAQSAGFYRI